ncbi:MAG: hypothetical protein ABIQ95_09570 [Bdellovibrionia bacterium]
MPNQIVTIRDSLYSALTVFMNYIPTLIGGILVLVVGWMVSSMIARLVERILVATKIDHATERTGLSEFMIGPQGRFKFSHGIGFLAKWFIRLLFLQAVANLLNMPQITAIMTSMLLFIPNIAVAMLILVVGLYLGQFVSNIVREAMAKSGVSRPGVIASICRYGIVGFSIIAALNHVGIGAVAINILFIGFVASLSLALGLAFGLGAQGVAAEVTRTWYEQNKPNRLKSIPGGQLSENQSSSTGTNPRSSVIS